MKITFTFVGRERGAIGSPYKITKNYNVESVSEAKSRFTRDYECFHDLRIKGCTDSQYERAEYIKLDENPSAGECRVLNTERDLEIYAKDQNDAYFKIHKAQSNSVDYAVKWGGFRVEEFNGNEWVDVTQGFKMI